MGKRLALPAVEVLAGLALLSCASSASSRPGIYWSEFAATEVNFQRYFDQAEGGLDGIEGIWSPETWSHGQFAILRNGSYPEYDYLIIRIPRGRTPHGEIVGALRFADLDLLVYEYACVDELRGEPCRTFPCTGTIMLVRGELWGDPKECFCGFCASYWIKRYPSR